MSRPVCAYCMCVEDKTGCGCIKEKTMKQVDSINISKEYVDETQNNGQEPVAWQWLDTANFRKSISDKANKNEWRPLYIEPQYRELSDEEINEVYNKIYEMNHMDLVTAFARAILKKANEK